MPLCSCPSWLEAGFAVDIAEWLRGLGLQQYEPAFRANEIDAPVLPGMTADDLRGLGVTAIGHRRNLLACDRRAWRRRAARRYRGRAASVRRGARIRGRTPAADRDVLRSTRALDFARLAEVKNFGPQTRSQPRRSTPAAAAVHPRWVFDPPPICLVHQRVTRLRTSSTARSTSFRA